MLVKNVQNESIAAQVNLEPGDQILAINGNSIEDILAYRFHVADEDLQIEVCKRNGEPWLLDIEKDFDEDLGLEFEQAFPMLHYCQNKCLFCFVDQMPPGLRKSLYVKDDDYRLSFWDGNFVTLTNLGTQELQRIATERLSPLYVSVHTTNPKLREKIMGHPQAGQVMKQLRFLVEAGIEIHTQVVLCANLNDGIELEKTVSDLAALRPGIVSLSIVPVGRTQFRKGLPALRPPEGEEAKRLINRVKCWQERFRKEAGTTFVHLADEFYLTTGTSMPDTVSYDDFPQLENGVGLTRIFYDEWEHVLKDIPDKVSPRRISFVSAKLGAIVIKGVVDKLNQVGGLQASLHVIENCFFGPTVTVSGLLTGKDIAEQLNTAKLGDRVILPGTAVRKDNQQFLDGLFLADLQARWKTPVFAAENPAEIFRAVFGDVGKHIAG